jgi:hypothetical protein
MIARFDDATVIVTGAGHGFGRAIALAFAERGARVWACDVQVEPLAETQRLGAALGGATGAASARAASTSPSATRSGVRSSPRPRAPRRPAPSTCWSTTPVASSGRWGVPLDEVTPEDWRALFAVNVDAAFTFAQAVGPAMKRARLGPHREHLERRRPRREPHRHPGLRQRQGGPDRPHPAARPRARALRHHRQQRRARLRPLEPHDRASVAVLRRGGPARARRAHRAPAPRARRTTSPTPSSSSRRRTRTGSRARCSQRTFAAGGGRWTAGGEGGRRRPAGRPGRALLAALDATARRRPRRARSPSSASPACRPTRATRPTCGAPRRTSPTVPAPTRASLDASAPRDGAAPGRDRVLARRPGRPDGADLRPLRRAAPRPARRLDLAPLRADRARRTALRPRGVGRQGPRVRRADGDRRLPPHDGRPAGQRRPPARGGGGDRLALAARPGRARGGAVPGRPRPQRRRRHVARRPPHHHDQQPRPRDARVHRPRRRQGPALGAARRRRRQPAARAWRASWRASTTTAGASPWPASTTTCGRSPRPGGLGPARAPLRRRPTSRRSGRPRPSARPASPRSSASGTARRSSSTGCGAATPARGARPCCRARRTPSSAAGSSPTRTPHDVRATRSCATSARHLPPGVTLEVRRRRAAPRAYRLPDDHPGLAPSSRTLRAVYGVEPWVVGLGGSVPICETFQRHLGMDTVFFSSRSATRTSTRRTSSSACTASPRGARAWADYLARFPQAGDRAAR